MCSSLMESNYINIFFNYNLYYLYRIIRQFIKRIDLFYRRKRDRSKCVNSLKSGGSVNSDR